MLLSLTVTTPNSHRLEALQDGFKNVVTRALEMTQWAIPRLFIFGCGSGHAVAFAVRTRNGLRRNDPRSMRVMLGVVSVRPDRDGSRLI
jgi:hypothetical protein